MTQPPEQPYQEDEPRPPTTRQQSQIEMILREFGNDVEVDPPTWRDTNDARYFYHRGRMLIRDRDLDRVDALFRRDGTPEGGTPFGDTIDGLTRYEPPPNFRFPVGTPEAPSFTLRCLAYVDQQLGPGVGRPDHLVHITDVSACPATEPEEVTKKTAAPLPDVSTDRCDGQGVKVVVVDVGWSEAPAAGWLTGVTGDVEVAFDPPASTDIRPYAGHGTFVAGVVRAIAPKAEVVVKGVFTRAGATWETDLVRKLDEALEESPDIISLSAGTRSRQDVSLLGLDVFVEERLSRLKGVVLVAAAGNDGDRGPFYPAAMPETVSVGALAANRRARAKFSNHGGWVDVYAPGEDLVNAYLTGNFTCRDPENIPQVRTFAGMCRWSGTSFSTPLVSGLIAARMSVTGENGQQAAEALLRFARTQAIPGVGAVLLPGQACSSLDQGGRRGCLLGWAVPGGKS
jgi:hypothetical protein